jgi:hypothetical protein
LALVDALSCIEQQAQSNNDSSSSSSSSIHRTIDLDLRHNPLGGATGITALRTVCRSARQVPDLPNSNDLTPNSSYVPRSSFVTMTHASNSQSPSVSSRTLTTLSSNVNTNTGITRLPTAAIARLTARETARGMEHDNEIAASSTAVDVELELQDELENQHLTIAAAARRLSTTTSRIGNNSGVDDGIRGLDDDDTPATKPGDHLQSITPIDMNGTNNGTTNATKWRSRFVVLID